MQYTKPALTYEEQADLLLQRGLRADRDTLIKRLQSVGYYRLCAYWHPFKQTDESFQPGATLEIVWERYSFDRKLRLAVMDAIERVEVGIRCSLVDMLAVPGGPFVHLDLTSFPGADSGTHARFLDELQGNAQKSREVFVQHFQNVYDEFPNLPLWAAAETMTFGGMFTLFKLSGKQVQQRLAQRFELPGVVLMSWLLTLNYVRNVCAHHSRLWNRELALRPQLPHEAKDARWYRPEPIDRGRVFVVLTQLRYLLRAVAFQGRWHERLFDLFDEYPNVPLAPMGVPTDWRTHSLWR